MFLRLGDYIGIIFKEISMSWDNIVDSKEFFMVRFWRGVVMYYSVICDI